MENSPYLFDQLTRKRSRTNSSSMDDDMEEDEEGGFHANNNRSPGSQGSAGWEVDQGKLRGRFDRNIFLWPTVQETRMAKRG